MSFILDSEETDEEYPEDLIQLNYEQDSIYHVNREAAGFKNLNGTWRLSEDIIFHPILQGLCTTPDISHKSIPQLDRLLRVKLIDCGKFPWYFKRYKNQIMNKISLLQVISVTDSDTEDDCIILRDPSSKNIIKTTSVCQVKTVAEESPSMQTEQNPLVVKRLDSIKRRDDVELQRALYQKNKNNIDIKRNKGLVGLTIMRKVTVNDVAPAAKKNKPEEESEKIEPVNTDTVYLNAADKILNSCGTDLIAVIEDLVTSAPTQQDETNETVKNVVSRNDILTVTNSPDRSLNISVESATDKKSREDILSNKFASSAEKAEKKVNTLQKLNKLGSVSENAFRLKLDPVDKLKKHVKDSKITNRYMNDQLKKKQIDTTNQVIDEHSKYVTVDQVKPNAIIQESVSKGAPGIKKDLKKLTTTTDKITTGFQNGLSSPILQSNSLFKKQYGMHESTPKRTKPKTQNTPDKASSKSATSNSLLRNETKLNTLKRSQSDDNRKKTGDIRISDPHDNFSANKTNQNRSTASHDQTKAPNKLHYYSLSYSEFKTKTIVGTKKNSNEKIKPNKTNSDTQNILGPRALRNNSCKESSIQILSVERINNNNSLTETQFPLAGETANRLPLSTPTSNVLSKYSESTANYSVQNKTNLRWQNVCLPNENSKQSEHYLIHNNNRVRAPNDKPSVICKRFGQPIHTYVSSRPMLPPDGGASSYTAITPQSYSNTAFMYRNLMQPKELEVNSSIYYHPTLQGLTIPVRPPQTIQSSQNIYPGLIYTNPNDHVSKNMLRDSNYCTTPSVYRNHYIPKHSRPQPLAPPYLPARSSHHSTQQTNVKPNQSQSRRCFFICDNNNVKERNSNTIVPSQADNGGLLPSQSSYNSTHQTTFKPNPSQSKQCLLVSDDINEKEKNTTTIVPSQAGNGGLPSQSTYHPALQTTVKPNSSQSKRCLLTCYNKNVKESNSTTSVPSPAGNGGLPSRSSYHSAYQTTDKPNRSQSKRCLFTSDKNDVKDNNSTTAVPSQAGNGSQVTKKGVTTSPGNILNIPASIVLETMETVDTKIKMLEELDKVIIEEDFDLYLDRVEKEKVNTTPKDNTQPQPKKVKTDNEYVSNNKRSEFREDTTNKINKIQHATMKKRNEINPTSPTKGYSPPILPIPGTIEEILEKVKSEPQDIAAKDPRHIQTDVRPDISTERAKKISLHEYKKRTSMHDGVDCSPCKKMRRERCIHGKSSRAKNQRNHSVDSDLGYDSDSTIII